MKRKKNTVNVRDEGSQLVVNERKVRRKGRIQSASSRGGGIDNMTEKPLSDYWGVGEVYCFIEHLAILAVKGS
jgi:hypothetical protein